MVAMSPSQVMRGHHDLIAHAEGDEDAMDVESLAGRLNSWEYRLTDYKAGLLTRRWEDLLKDSGSDAAG